MKAYLAITFALAGVTACAAPVGTTAPGSTPRGPGTSAVVSSSPATDGAETVTVRDFTLEPKDISVHGAFTLAVTNGGPTVHNVSIRDASGTVVDATKDLKSGQSETIRVDIPPGTYVLFCSLPGHESLGIKGTLIVSK